MPATNHTKNFNLPQYIDSDHFNIVGDFNGAMSKIDETLGESLVTAKAASRDATSALASANDASDNTAAAKEAAQSALSVSATAKGDAQNAKIQAGDAKKLAEQAISASTSAASSANNALKNSNSAIATANNASQAADAASAASANAQNTAASLAGGIAEAKAAGNAAANIRTRFYKFSNGDTDRKVRSANDSETKTIIEGAVTLDANDVINVIADLHHDTQGSNAIHWFLFMKKPSGATTWFSNSGSQGPWDGSYVHSQVAGIFRADEGAGQYTVSIRYNGPTDRDTTIFMRNCAIYVH